MIERLRIIEVDGEAVGIVLVEGRRCVFTAAKPSCWPLDGMYFRCVESARLAAARLERASSKHVSRRVHA